MRRGQSKGALTAGALVVAAIAIVGLGWYFSPNFLGVDPDSDDPKVAFSQAELKLAVEAVAAAEDADYRRAITLWEELSELIPEDEDIQLNQAVTVLKWIEETNNVLSSGKVGEPAELEAIQRELSLAYDTADDVITRLTQLETADYRATLLQAALLEAQARQMQYPEDLELRKQAANLLADALEEDPAQPILASKLDELAQEFAPEENRLSAVQADALYASWQAQPRNLYLLARAADTLLRNEDARLLNLLEPSLEVTKPMWSLVAPSLSRIDPEELIDGVKQAIADGNWAAANRIRLWLNLFKAMSFNSDRRLVQPDLMALLDTSFLTRIGANVEVDAKATAALPNYQVHELEFPSQQVAWYDIDLDFEFEVISLHDRELSLARHVNASEFRLDQTLELSFSASGFLIADLFEVDDPNRPRLPSSVAELMQADGGNASKPATERQAAGAESFSDQSPDAATNQSHDTLRELVVWGPEQVVVVGVEVDAAQRKLMLKQIEGASGLESLQNVRCGVPLDIESDGDLDLIFASDTDIHIMQNNGNRTFQEISQYSQLALMAASELKIQRMVAVDYDSDLDQDVMLIANNSNSLWVLENLLHGQFRARELTGEQWPVLTNPTDLAVADLDGNVSWDWVIASSQRLTSVSTRTPEPGTVVPLQLSVIDSAVTEVEVADLNNDGFEDVLGGSNAGLAVFSGSLNSLTNSQPQVLGDSNEEISGLQVADCNQDGWLDLAVIAGGKPRILQAQPDLENDYLAVRVRGINDANGGGRINHYAIGSVLEIWSGGKQQRRVIQSPVTHFGLGNQSAENLRVIFTNGLTQNLEEPESNTLVQEVQELKGSCPFLYGWNGKRFELITDLLWNAPLGLQVARGQVMPDRRWEYLHLPGHLVQPKDGGYELRVTEELWEVAYFDHLQLTALDHPPEIEVFTNEKVGPAEIAHPEIFGFAERIAVQSATDASGRDWTSRLQHRDRRYATAFRRLFSQGLAEPHYIELDFGALPVDEPLQLVLTGWLYPTDTSLNIGISQNEDRNPPEPPSLWVVDKDGTWVCAKPFMGFPGGKPKSIVVGLDGVFRSQDHRLRIGSSQQLCWDEAFVASPVAPDSISHQPVELQSAVLRYRGFSRLLPRPADQPHWYDYQDVSLQPKWPPLEGPFTRWGDVRELLQADDDRMVVMTAGDEIVLRFSMPDRELPNGWQRDFVLHSTGWDKDADLNTLAGQGSLPLPFSSQASYPPPPDQAKQAAHVWALNSEHLTRPRIITRRNSD